MGAFLFEKMRDNNMSWEFKALVSRIGIADTLLSYADSIEAQLIILGTKSSGQVYGSTKNHYKMGNSSMDILHKNKKGIPVIICPSKGQMYEKIYMKHRTVNRQQRNIQYSQINDL